jgi:hypothetical protein
VRRSLGAKCAKVVYWVEYTKFVTEMNGEEYYANELADAIWIDITWEELLLHVVDETDVDESYEYKYSALDDPLEEGAEVTVFKVDCDECEESMEEIVTSNMRRKIRAALQGGKKLKLYRVPRDWNNLRGAIFGASPRFTCPRSRVTRARLPGRREVRRRIEGGEASDVLRGAPPAVGGLPRGARRGASCLLLADPPVRHRASPLA